MQNAIARIRVEELARQVVAEVAAEASYVLCAQWINDKYKEFVRKARPRHLSDIGELNVPGLVGASINDPPSIGLGTVTPTRGSNILPGDATAVAFWGDPEGKVGDNSFIGWHIRMRTAWYEIRDVDITNSRIILKSAFGEDPYLDVNGSTVSTSYQMAKRFHSLPSDVHWIQTMIHPRRRIPIENVHRDVLDKLYTERLAVGTLIQFWADQGVDPETGNRRIELYPPTKEFEMVIYSYSRLPAKLELDDFIPRFLDSDALKEGVKIQALEHKAAKAADDGKVDLAGFYANWAARQRVIWQSVLRSAIIAEKGADDQSAILQVLKTRGGYGAGGDIATAREQVYAQWTPLT